MNEDYLRNRTGPEPENLVVMRRLALNLVWMTQDRKIKSMRGKLNLSASERVWMLFTSKQSIAAITS